MLFWTTVLQCTLIIIIIMYTHSRTHTLRVFVVSYLRTRNGPHQGRDHDEGGVSGGEQGVSKTLFQ